MAAQSRCCGFISTIRPGKLRSVSGARCICRLERKSNAILRCCSCWSPATAPSRLKGFHPHAEHDSIHGALTLELRPDLIQAKAGKQDIELFCRATVSKKRVN